MKRFLIPIVFLFITQITSASKTTQPAINRMKVACVGNSVTFGYGLQDPAKESYPSQLGSMLGESYEVRNFGKSGATLLSKGHNPYLKSEEYRKVLDYHPDIVIIDLGLNDTDPRNLIFLKESGRSIPLIRLPGFQQSVIILVWSCKKS